MRSACRCDIVPGYGRGIRCLGYRPEGLSGSTVDGCVCTCALGLRSRNIALAGRVRYHVNVFWENAPDRRTSRTLDWLNDACEARLGEEDRSQGRVTYAALMSPKSITFRQANRARKYTGFPISLLVTKKPDTTDAGGTSPEIEPHVLLGMKKRRRLGRRAAVRKYRRADIQKAVKSGTDDFQCTLYLSTDTIDLSTDTIDVRFATNFEVNVLVECLKPKSKGESETAAAKSSS
jgi:hypothetical protein